MAMAGIAPLSRKPVGRYPAAKCKETSLCRALISDPSLLILDEPTNFVDNKFEKELYEILASPLSMTTHIYRHGVALSPGDDNKLRQEHRLRQPRYKKHFR